METEPEHATVLYFYRATCEECIQTKPVIDGIPDTLCINGRWTQVDVLRLNTRSGTNGEKSAGFSRYTRCRRKNRWFRSFF